MKKSTAPLLVGLCVAGLSAGFAARRISSRGADSPASAAAGVEISSRKQSGPATGVPALPEIPPARSTDTMESLAALDGGALYPRLAVWLADAGVADIAAFWESYRGKQPRDFRVANLVFIQWTKLDPLGAIAGGGERDARYAWWAWPAHDPAAALAAAIATGGDRANYTAAGIGEFQPGWLREHFEKIPGFARGNAMEGMLKWSDGSHPLESLEFLKQHGTEFDAETFRNLVREDPWAALDWMEKNPGKIASRYRGNERMDTLIATMAAERPEDLQRLADQSRPGELKRKAEAALFDNLLASDPEAALARARTTEVPILAAERLAKIGMQWLRTDPEKALGIAAEIFEANPGGRGYAMSLRYPNGSMTSGTQGPAKEFIGSLLATEPERILEIASRHDAHATSMSGTFSELARDWASQDAGGFAEWVNRQSDPLVRDAGSVWVINRLATEGRYPEAVAWATSSEKLRQDYLPAMLAGLDRAEPGSAAKWLEESSLPADVKSEAKEGMKNYR